jgi:hypothetical protein
MLEDLGVSTLRSIKTMTLFFFSFLSIKAAMLPASMLGDYSTSVSSTPSYFLHHTDLLGNPFLITSLLDLLFLLFSSLFWITIPAILPATMLGYYSMSASSMPSELFFVVSMYWKSASYRSSLDLSSFGKTTNRSVAKRTCSFFLLNRHACYSTCR